MRLLAIINPKSGTGSKARVPDVMSGVLGDVYDIDYRYVKEEGDARRFATEAVAAGYDAVAAVGGDGTINGAATALIGTGVALAVVPCGSGNGLARHLNIPMNLEKAVALIKENNVLVFDHGLVNDRPFFCTCGVGFDAHVAYKFANDSRRGPLTYIKNTLIEYVNYHHETYSIEIDGVKLEERAFVVACCNAAQYGNNAFIAPHASMQDGMLDITVITPFRVLTAAELGIRLFAQSIDKNRHVTVYRAKQAVITREHEGAMHIDGDPVMMPPRLEVKIVPQKIKIFASTKGEKTK